jgi:hypothetical protein
LYNNMHKDVKRLRRFCYLKLKTGQFKGEKWTL